MKALHWGIILLITCTIILTWAILTCVKEYFESNDPILNEIRLDVAKVDPRILNIPLYIASKSYTINKEKTYLCLFDENGKYYDKNMLIYVLLHEFAHIINHEIGHPPSFVKTFDELLRKAEEVGIWSRDKTIIQNYCQYNK